MGFEKKARSMLTKYLETTTLPQVLHSALNILGDKPKDALLLHLDCDYGIRVFGAGPIFIDELEWAFSDMFGEAGCELLIQHLHSEAERFKTKTGYLLTWHVANNGS